MGELMEFPGGANASGEGEAKEGKVLEFKRKLAEQVPEKKAELREKIDVQISGEDLHAILVGLVHERRALKAQLDEVKGDSDLEAALGPMVEGLLARNADLMTRLSSQDPMLEEHFKKAIE